MSKYYIKNRDKVLARQKENREKKTLMLIAEGKPPLMRGRPKSNLTEEEKKQRQKEYYKKHVEKRKHINLEDDRIKPTLNLFYKLMEDKEKRESLIKLANEINSKF